MHPSLSFPAPQAVSCDEALGLYLDHLTLRGRAPATMRTYASSVGAFYAFLGTRGRDPATTAIETVQPGDVASFLLQVTRAGKKPATRAAYLTALTALFRFL